MFFWGEISYVGKEKKTLAKGLREFWPHDLDEIAKM
jgi:hypothetical protein